MLPWKLSLFAQLTYGQDLADRKRQASWFSPPEDAKQLSPPENARQFPARSVNFIQLFSY
jgi:hypothetical protein